jgi:hypothetical protein
MNPHSTIIRLRQREIGMARTGITYDDVAQTATALLARGENPTIQRIREQLGSGSNTTISNHLRLWQQQRREDSALSLPPSLPEQLLPALETFWQIAVEQAAATFEQERAAARREMEETRQARDEALAECRQLVQERSTLNTELERVGTLLQQREQALDDERETRRRLQSELHAAGERGAALEEALSESRAALAETRREHQQALTEQERKHEQQLADERQRAEAEQSRLLRQIDDERQSARAERRALEQQQEQERARWGEARQQSLVEHRQQRQRLETALEQERAARQAAAQAQAMLQGRVEQQAETLTRLETALSEQRERELALNRDNERLIQEKQRLAEECKELVEALNALKPRDDGGSSNVPPTPRA